tara:strand:- start:614 stop:859 length:246 start_codon:yes stop_codon:yes gene_type:complete
MKSISNNTLVALLAVALVVSVSASLYSLTEVTELGGGFDMLTSAAVADVEQDTKENVEEPSNTQDDETVDENLDDEEELEE